MVKIMAMMMLITMTMPLSMQVHLLHTITYTQLYTHYTLYTIYVHLHTLYFTYTHLYTPLQIFTLVNIETGLQPDNTGQRNKTSWDKTKILNIKELTCSYFV